MNPDIPKMTYVLSRLCNNYKIRRINKSKDFINHGDKLYKILSSM